MALHENLDSEFLDNFRVVYPYLDDANDGKSPGVIFRSAKLNLKEKHIVHELEKLNIQSVIDFGDSHIERKVVTTKDPVPEPIFTKKRTVLTSNEHYKPDEELVFKVRETAPSSEKTLFSINIFSSIQMVWTAFTRVAWYYTLMGLCLLVYDFIFRTEYKNFISLCFHIETLTGGLLRLYKDILEGGQKGICAALKILSDEKNYPIVISCAAGKDRTGLVSALVHHCLGKPKDYIAQDYGLSEAAINNMSEDKVFKKICKVVNFPINFQGAKAETMSATLQYLEDEYGSVDNYLEYIGFTQKDQDKLRASVHGYNSQRL